VVNYNKNNIDNYGFGSQNTVIQQNEGRLPAPIVVAPIVVNNNDQYSEINFNGNNGIP
jgi:hypothetical protein